MKRFLTIALTALVTLTAIILILSLAGCSNTSQEPLLQETEPKAGDKIAVMETSMGTIKLRFFPEQAPKAVENFLTLSEEGYYEGVTFHRVIQNFMIQGGDPTGTGRGGTSIFTDAAGNRGDFEDEFSDQLFNFRGALSMANAGANTNGSQFFIVQATSVPESELAAIGNKQAKEKYQNEGGTPWLDGAHTVFGQVIEGMDVVDAIAAVEVDPNSYRPLEDVVILSVTVEEYAG